MRLKPAARGATIKWMSTRAGVAVVLLALTAACSSPSAPQLPSGAIRINGAVQLFDLEGGFWAVKGDDGITYDPKGGLPTQFQVKNLRVKMVAIVRNDLGGTHMVGPIVEVLSIERE
jgi:hypothetical protein